MATAFVDFPGHAYGTQSSTVLLVSRPPVSPRMAGHRLEIHERTHGFSSCEKTSLAFSFRDAVS